MDFSINCLFSDNMTSVILTIKCQLCKWPYSCSKLHFPGGETEAQSRKGVRTVPQKGSGRSGTMFRPPSSGLFNFSSRI